MTTEPQTCHWAREADGTTTLIPGCWARVIDPDAKCTCGEWSEDTARETIRGLKAALYRTQYQNQKLRAGLKAANIADPTQPCDWRILPALRRRRQMHIAISAAGET